MVCPIHDRHSIGHIFVCALSTTAEPEKNDIRAIMCTKRRQNVAQFYTIKICHISANKKNGEGFQIHKSDFFHPESYDLMTFALSIMNRNG